MEANSLSGTLVVILHADVAGSTELVQRNEQITHARIRESFERLRAQVETYQGRVLEIRGDALLAQFERASDAVSAALAFQGEHKDRLAQLEDDLKPEIRIGIALGEVIIADDTVTGAGVVLAQRVEQLADAGGVCVTAALHEALPGRMPFDLENIGEQNLKGFTESVRVYRVGLNEGASVPQPQIAVEKKSSSKFELSKIAIITAVLILAAGTIYQFNPDDVREEPASIENMAFPLPDKPSIAVLPFNNMSNDPEQGYFADGMTEDLITDISKISGMFVIARNSVFTYKGRAVKIRQVAEELGVRYVMEGSVRRSGDQIRVNAQLIDANTGGHLWAERYDGTLDDVFKMQDQIVKKIVTALAVTLTDRGDESEQSGTVSTEAYDAYLKGWEYYRRWTPDDFLRAIEFFEQALELDPDYADARSALAAVYWNATWRRWFRTRGLSYSQIAEGARVRLQEALKTPSALTYQVASERAAFTQRRADKALTQAEMAISLDSNDPAGYLAKANALIKDKRPEEAIEAMRQAMRLDPHFPAAYLTRLGRAQFDLGQYEEAAATLEDSVQRNSQDDRAYMYLAAAYGQLGKLDAGKSALAMLNALLALGGWDGLSLEEIRLMRWTGNVESLRSGLKKAGVTVKNSGHSLVTQTGDSWDIKGSTKIDLKTAKSFYDKGIPFVAVNSRYHRQRIPGSHYLNWWRGSNDQRPREFTYVRLSEIAGGKSEPIVLYALAATREEAASVAYAVVGGFEKIYFFEDGFDQWKAAGYPVETN